MGGGSQLPHHRLKREGVTHPHCSRIQAAFSVHSILVQLAALQASSAAAVHSIYSSRSNLPAISQQCNSVPGQSPVASSTVPAPSVLSLSNFHTLVMHNTGWPTPLFEKSLQKTPDRNSWFGSNLMVKRYLKTLFVKLIENYIIHRISTGMRKKNKNFDLMVESKQITLKARGWCNCNILYLKEISSSGSKFNLLAGFYAEKHLVNHSTTM